MSGVVEPSALLLVPRPQRLRRTDGVAAADVPVEERSVGGLQHEGFRLAIHPDRIVLEHRGDGDNGRRYGLAALDQIRRQSGDHISCLRIEDWPDFPTRAFMLDISRDRVPTRATLERLVDVMSLARINQFQLYTEHTFAYRQHETVWHDASPITPDDVRWLDELTSDNGITLVPNQNCFGHMERWLRHDAYRARAETPRGYEIMEGVLQEPAVLAPTPENAAFVLSLFEELLPNFASRQVHIGCDETMELGLGASKGAVATRGRERVYLDHLGRIAGPLLERGYEVQFWADVLRHEPALTTQLPDGMIPVAWAYEAPARGDGTDDVDVPAEVREVLGRLGVDLDALRSFAATTIPLAKAGLPFWVAPGTSGWLSLVGRLDNALANMVDAAEVGRADGASGYLIADWGDGGHTQPPSVSFGPLVYGGAVAWALAANRDLDVAAVLDHHVFADRAGRLGAALDILGRAWRHTGHRAINCSPLLLAVATDIAHLVSGQPDPAQLTPLVDDLDRALVEIHESVPTSVDADLVRHELGVSARLARHGAYRLLAQAGGRAPDTAVLRRDLAEAIDGYQEAWFARARPGGFTDSVSHFRHTLAQYG
jgi:hypothetical protein